MISHKYRVIFVHIPRTAGSSIEKWLVGDDWWNIDPETKHLLASQAKEKYAEYWDDYLKFSIVRHPMDRLISCLNFSGYFGISVGKGKVLDLQGYRNKFQRKRINWFGRRVYVEHDHRFYDLDELDVKKNICDSMYGNILDVDLDYIFKFEELEKWTDFLAGKLGCAPFPVRHKEVPSSNELVGQKEEIYSANKKMVKRLFIADYRKYGYS